MRIRNILMLALLFATLVPAFAYGIWSYNHGLRHEFEAVKDRHLLIARNLGHALERYYVDLSATFDSISAAMVANGDIPRLTELMGRLNIVCILVVDKESGRILSRAGLEAGEPLEPLPKRLLAIALDNVRQGETTFSPVVAGPTGNNELLAIHEYGDRLAVARIETSYFVNLGKSVAFGKKGHAAIVDREGNVLAHPLPAWVAERKNISKVSAVKRMMAGETGIEQFYSPALEGDMIAGLTTVEGPGWGVMVPQPVSEINDEVFDNSITILAVLMAGATLTFLIVALLVRSLVAPLEKFVGQLRENARSRTLRPVSVKPTLIRIRELVDYENTYNHMVEEVTDAHRKFREFAFTDAVTGLPNRARFQEIAAKLVSRQIESGRGGVLLYVDFDDFKEINDLHGHDVGDEFLRHAARSITSVASSFRSHDRSTADVGSSAPLVARLGGDEFALLIPGPTDPTRIGDLMDTLQKEILSCAKALGLSEQGSASIGAAVFPRDDQSVAELLKLADIAMYHAKKAGKRRGEVYRPAIGRQTAAEMRNEVLRAIAEDELTLEYQPKVSALDHAPTGVEALVRWHHPERGVLGPDLWLPAITNSPLIVRLGEWVLQRAMADYFVWAGSNDRLTLALNFGSTHFAGDGFAEWLEDATRTAGFDPRRFTIEVTEDTLMASAVRADDTVKRLHERGFAISIDDFGKGYSNISRLAHLPVDQIKIDRGIVAGAHADSRFTAIVKSIIVLAHQLGCETVAEGIETQEQAEFMAALGADTLQGFHFSRSLPAHELANWIMKAEAAAGDAARWRLAGALQ